MKLPLSMGGLSARRRREIQAQEERVRSILPAELEHVFDEHDIELTWNFLEKVFHLNKTKWKAFFEEEFKKSSRDISKQELFVRFGRVYFEEPLSKIVYRGVQSGLWFEVLKHVVKDKLREKQIESYSTRKLHNHKHGL